jgi:transposase-like protein
MADYPRNLRELEKRFDNEEACREYLLALRWPDGYRCPRCGHGEAWRTGQGLYRCKVCDYKCSIISGTIFEGTRKPLTLWFRAIWWVCSPKSGARAKTVQRILELGGYQTAWVRLQKLRCAMVRTGRDKLSGTGEVDETFVGGEKPGKRGRGAAGKALVGLAVEEKGAEGIGRIRLGILPDASEESLSAFAKERIEPGSTVRSDDWNGYIGLSSAGYRREVVKKTELKAAHLVASLLKRWLLGANQGAVSHEHLDYYLDEFTFRFNRRTSTHRGKLFYRLLQNATQAEPVPFKQIIRNVPGRGRAKRNI